MERGERQVVWFLQAIAVLSAISVVVAAILFAQIEPVPAVSVMVLMAACLAAGAVLSRSEDGFGIADMRQFADDSGQQLVLLWSGLSS